MKKLLAVTAATAMMASTAFAGGHSNIKIGVILGFTGPIESLTPPMGDGAEFAMKEVTDSGKLLGGASVTSVRADSTCIDAAAATAAAERLITSDGVKGIMGADCSGVTGAILANVALANGVVMISPSATSPGLSTAEDNGLFFRTAPSDARQGVVMTEVLMEQGIKEVAVTYTNNDYGKGLADSFAAAFEAIRCDIYTDVDGIYTTDPRITEKARKLNKISFEEMLELASLGAKVLQTRSVELAMRFNVKLRVLSSFDKPECNAGTLVCSEEEIMESNIVSGIAHSRDEAKMTLISVADRPGIAAAIFGPLSEAGVNVDMIIQNIAEEGRTDMTFSCPTDQVLRAEKALNSAKNEGDINFSQLVADTNVAKISAVGIGMRSQSGVAAKMFRTLSDEGINIKVIATSEIKISVLIDRKYMELAVQSLHDAFDLEKIA